MTAQPKPRILVLCTHNSNRSQMAEELLRALGGDRLGAYSAGLKPRGVNLHAVKVLQEIGTDEHVLAQYRRVRDLIRNKVSQWLGELHPLGE